MTMIVFDSHIPRERLCSTYLPLPASGSSILYKVEWICNYRIERRAVDPLRSSDSCSTPCFSCSRNEMKHAMFSPAIREAVRELLKTPTPARGRLQQAGFPHPAICIVSKGGRPFSPVTNLGDLIDQHFEAAERIRLMTSISIVRRGKE